jgi:hypothetical protein
MELRPLTRQDLGLYERIYTDPRMWLELAGVGEQDMAAKLERDVASVDADRHWVRDRSLHVAIGALAVRAGS